VTAQFDVVRNKNPSARKQFPYLLILQHKLLDELDSVVVAPIRLAQGRIPAPRLVPVIKIKDVEHHIVMYSLASVSWESVGETLANLMDQRDEIIRAYDIIVSGV
jgi:toxin CcdB